MPSLPHNSIGIGPTISKIPSKIVFFGTPEFSVIILDELAKAGLTPDLVVTNPDRPKGRDLVLTAPPVKEWAEKARVPVYQPEKLGEPEFLKVIAGADLFIVAAYGKIIPQVIIDMPRRGVLNVHPSLLPRYRGASPLQSAILADDRDVGVSIMQIDAKMDHGPLVAVKKVAVGPWPPSVDELSHLLGMAGGALLAEIIPAWLAGIIEAVPQDHSKATYTKKIEKQDGEIRLSDDPYSNFLKIQAFAGWPGAYFFTKKGERVLIKKATFENGELKILRVLHAGKNTETDYSAE